MNRWLGRGFIVIDRITSGTVGAGMLDFALRRSHNIYHQHTDVDKAARATLMQGGKVIGQQTFVANAPAHSADAAGGARALAAASDDLVAQIATWLGSQALVAAQ